MPVPEQQVALKRMRKLRAAGASLRAISDKMKVAGVSITPRREKRPCRGQSLGVRLIVPHRDPPKA